DGHAVTTAADDHTGCALISVTVTPASVLLAVGETQQLVAKPPPPCGGDAPKANFLWQSSNVSIVSVDSLGTVRALAKGSATVIAALAADPNVKGASAVVVAAGSASSRLPASR